MMPRIIVSATSGRSCRMVLNASSPMTSVRTSPSALGGVGFLDDYLKVVKRLRKGLIGEYKIAGQILVGVIVGGVLYFSPNFAHYNSVTTVPFFKNLVLDFGVFYIPMIILVITATSNAVNLTDGLDGLAIGTVSIAFLAIALISYLGGNFNYARYLNIIYLPGSGELTPPGKKGCQGIVVVDAVRLQFLLPLEQAQSLLVPPRLQVGHAQDAICQV